MKNNKQTTRRHITTGIRQTRPTPLQRRETITLLDQPDPQGFKPDTHAHDFLVLSFYPGMQPDQPTAA